MPTTTAEALANDSLRSQSYDSLFLTTDELPEKDRLAIWHELYGRTLFNLGVTPHEGATFKADALVHRLRDIYIAKCNSTQALYYTDSRHLQNAQDSISIFTVESGKAHGKQHGRDAIVGPGEGFVILNSEQASVNVIEDGCYVTIYVPRQLISRFVPNLNDLLMRPGALNSTALKLLTGYAACLQKSADQLDPVLRHAIAGHLGDLAVCAMGANCQQEDGGRSRSIKAAFLRAIRQDVLDHLTDQTLSIELVGQRQGISPDKIRSVLDEEGRTFFDLVLHLRLLRSYQLLCDPGHIELSMADIAFETGFDDVFCFNRLFKRHFHMTPNDARVASRQHRR